MDNANRGSSRDGVYPEVSLEEYNNAVELVLRRALDGITTLEVTDAMRQNIVQQVSSTYHTLVDSGVGDMLFEHLNGPKQ